MTELDSKSWSSHHPDDSSRMRSCDPNVVRAVAKQDLDPERKEGPFRVAAQSTSALMGATFSTLTH